MKKVVVKNSGKYCYVEGDDCYIFYYLFNYRLNGNRCYFKSRYLEKIITFFNKKQVNCELEISDNIYNDINYIKYLTLGKKKYEFDKYLFNIENKLSDIVDNKNFNKIYRRIINKVYV